MRFAHQRLFPLQAQELIPVLGLEQGTHFSGRESTCCGTVSDGLPVSQNYPPAKQKILIA